MISRTLEEKVMENARAALVDKARIHPFRTDELTLPYYYIQEMVRYLQNEGELYLIQAKPSIIRPPPELTDGLRERFRKEIGYEEAMLYRFVKGRLISTYWDHYPLEGNLIAEGMCQAHPDEMIRYGRPLTETDLEEIGNLDKVFTPERIFCTAAGTQIAVPVENASFIFRPRQEVESQPSERLLVTKIAFRPKLKSLGQKLAMGAVGYKPDPTDSMGARIVCPDMESYHTVVTQLLELILDPDHPSIDLVPIDGAIEEHVSIYRRPEDTVESRNRILIGSLGHGYTTILNGPNGGLPYEATHMTLINPLEADPSVINPFELQVRTEEMDYNAECGAAAHSLYEKKKSDTVTNEYPYIPVVTDTFMDIYGIPGRTA